MVEESRNTSVVSVEESQKTSVVNSTPKHQDSSDEDVERQKQEIESDICMVFFSCNFASSSLPKLSLHHDYVAMAKCNISVQDWVAPVECHSWLSSPTL
jgi:hypothetical protein